MALRYPLVLNGTTIEELQSADSLDVTSASISGDLTFTGTGARVKANFSDPIANNRLLFQTSTANSTTAVGIAPSGTGSTAIIYGVNNSDLTNASYFDLRVSGSGNDVRLTSDYFGAGSYLPITFYTGGLEQVRITANSGGPANFQFSQSGTRVIGDFSNPIASNRVLFQTSTANSTTAVGIMPSGTGSTSIIYGTNSSTLTNASYFDLRVSGSGNDVRLTSDYYGAGTYLPITFYTGGSERVRIDTSGNVGIGTISPTATLNVVAATSSDAFRITQTGAGNALVVEDSANPDSTPFVINTDGKVGIGLGGGGIFGDAGIQMQAESSSGPATFYLRRAETASGASSVFFDKLRGTFASPIIVNSGDSLGNLIFRGYDGSGNISAAQIIAAVDGTPGTNDMPGRLVFSTTADGASSPTEKMRINNAGNVLLGRTFVSGGERLGIGGNTSSISTTTSATGILNDSAVSPAQTNSYTGYNTFLSTGAASFTLTNLRHFSALQNTIGAGSTVTNQYGFFVDASLTGATNNYGFYSGIASGSNRYNFYAAGTAENYFAGTVGIGAVASSIAGTQLLITGNGTGAVNSRFVYSNPTFQSDVTNAARGFQTSMATAAASFTIANMAHFQAQQGTFGAGSAVGSQYGFEAQSSLTGATNNYGFYSNIASGSGRYNFYAAGTAANYFAGNVGIGGDPLVPTLETFSNSNNWVRLNATGIPLFAAYKSNGTIAAKTIVVSGDEVGRFDMRAYDGANFIPLAQISGYVDGTPGLNDMPGRLVFSTTADGASSPTERMRIDSTGNVGIGGATSPIQPLTIASTSFGINVFRYSATPALSGGIDFRKSASGTVNTNTIVVNGESLGRVLFSGYDGASYIAAGQITVEVDGAPGLNDMPGRLVFSTTRDGASSATEAFRINSSQNVLFGRTYAANERIGIGGGTSSISTATNANGITNDTIVSSPQTNIYKAYDTYLSTQAAAFTLTTLRHFSAAQFTIGAGSTVTNQQGFFADGSMVGATNNYGFYSAIASGTGRYNFYAAGTADNYFAGPLLLGTTVALPVISGFSATKIQIVGNDPIGVFRFSADTSGPNNWLCKSRAGTTGVQTIVQANDELGVFNFSGSDGSNFIKAATISAAVDSTPGTNDMPGRLVFSTTADGASSPTERMRIDNQGRVGIGTTSLSGCNLRVGRNITGAAISIGATVQATIQSDVTSLAYLWSTYPSTQATAFTLADLRHYDADQGTIGAGSTVTNQFGFRANSSLTGATNNYGFYSNIASGSGRFNFYAAGTADNYFAGAIGVGIGPTSGTHGLIVSSTLTAATSQSITGQPTFDAAVTQGRVFMTFPSTNIGSALTNLFHYRANQGTVSGTVNNQFGFAAEASLTGATNNYGFYSSIASGTGRYNFYAAGTADNYFAGNVKTDGTLAGGYLALSAGATAMALASDKVVKVTPNATATFTTTVAPAGATASIIIVTSGTTSYTITFGTGFLTTGTLATGTVTAKTFVVNFVSDGTTMIETSRTVAM